MDFKQIIADSIEYENIDKQTILTNLTTPPDDKLGDYSLPCFCFAKTLRKSPVAIAEELKTCIKPNAYIEKIEVVNGYLNFYLNKQHICQNVITNAVKGFDAKPNNNKLMCIDYSSVNLAKYMHIGHWSTTIIGEALARLYENRGYKVVRMKILLLLRMKVLLLLRMKVLFYRE